MSLANYLKPSTNPLEGPHLNVGWEVGEFFVCLTDEATLCLMVQLFCKSHWVVVPDAQWVLCSLDIVL